MTSIPVVVPVMTILAAAFLQAPPATRGPDVTELRSQPLFTIRMNLHPIQELGVTPLGQRRIVPVAGGTFEGARLRGVVLGQAGGDWLLMRADGVFQLDVRVTLQTDDGALILMTYRGVRHAPGDVTAKLARGERVDPSQYYLRTAPFFETSSPRYGWLNNIVAVAMGERLPDGVVYRVFEVL